MYWLCSWGWKLIYFSAWLTPAQRGTEMAFHCSAGVRLRVLWEDSTSALWPLPVLQILVVLVRTQTERFSYLSLLPHQNSTCSLNLFFFLYLILVLILLWYFILSLFLEIILKADDREGKEAAMGCSRLWHLQEEIGKLNTFISPSSDAFSAELFEHCSLSRS